MALTNEQLAQGAQVAEFSVASRRKSTSLYLQMSLGFVSSTLVLMEDHILLLFGLFLTAILVGLWFYFDRQYIIARDRAERLRHYTIFAVGMGVSDYTELRTLLADCASREDAWASSFDADYYASGLPLGPEKFREMFEESAFWTGEMAKHAAREMTYRLAAVLLMVILAVFLAALVTDHSLIVTIERISVTLVLVLISADFVGSVLSFRSASAAAEKTVSRLAALKGAEIDKLCYVFADYNLAVEAMPLFSAGLYGRHKRSLNEAYVRFRGAESVA